MRPLVAAIVALALLPATAAADLDVPWTGSGPGVAFADGSHGNPRIDFGPGTATFKTFAAQTRDVTVHWTYAGAPVRLQRFVVHGLLDVEYATLDPEGETTFSVNAGEAYGFELSGGPGRLELRPPGPTVEVGATVPAMLRLDVAGPVSLGTFTPGVAKTYSATLNATVTSTAASAQLAVSGPGRLVNGVYALLQPLLVERSTLPVDVFALGGPVSDFPVSLQVSQRIEATDPLRAGTYSMPLTLTLSTTEP